MNLLITRHDKIGDFVTTLPLFKAIKAQYPEIKVTALVAKINAQLAKDIGFIDDVIVYQQDDFWQVVKQLKRARFDASISGFIDTRLGLLLWLAGIPKRIAPATKLAQFFFNGRIVQRRSRVEKTEVAYNLDLGQSLLPNLNINYNRPIINIAQPSFDDSSTPKIVVFHAGFGGSSDGNLCIDDYLRLAKAASQRDDVQVIFTFGPDDAATRETIVQRLDFEATLLDSTGSLMEFCQFLAHCTLFVSTSTGPMHLAGAVNINTLSFFGDTLFASSQRWATVSDPAKQHNVMLPPNYDETCYQFIEKTMLEVLS